ncbi:hypothetical protein KAF81_32400 [Pseudomonas aeruginosa]|uniref:hypothetical protein n=1 Tax=Pseudomonadota TaxID=1224 RepID=UPI0012AA5BBC|nr:MULTISPECIES: hypothetical protein [Pseudomonadota]MBP8322349.1 hypothetical protein [Pseudomonas aeruginosa]CUR69133.1 hypothetical protein BN2877_45700 [Achromobacter xylosoxidans]
MRKDGISLERTYRQVENFDHYQKDRILNLMLLKHYCIERDNVLRHAYQFHGRAASFFTAIVGAVDCLLFAQINEEATACLEKGGGIGDLLGTVMEDAENAGIPLSRIKHAVVDMESLFQDRGEYVRGSLYLDFIVGTYSALEFYMAKIYDRIRLEHPSSNSKIHKLKKLIEKYNTTEGEDKGRILNEIAELNTYVSGREKIDFVLSKLPKDESRGRSNYASTVSFYARARNSVHNLGFSGSPNDAQYSIEERELIHNAGEALLTEDRSDIVRLCQKLVEIYDDVVSENLNFDSEIFLDTRSDFSTGHSVKIVL